MAVTHPHRFSCACGAQMEMPLAHSVNVARTPEVRQQIIEKRWQSVQCPSCQGAFVVERPFYYTDLARHAVYLVQPRSRRYRYRSDSQQLQEQAKAIPSAQQLPRQAEAGAADSAAPAAPAPESCNGGSDLHLRVLYGLGELREKLLAQDAALDDRILEICKILLVYEHPFLLQKLRLQIFLDGFDGAQLHFIAVHHNQPDSFRASFPLELARGLHGRETELRAWLAQTHQESLFSSQDCWVNFRRYSRRYSPLEQLQILSDAQQAGQPPDLADPKLARMLKKLPRGAQLPGWAKQSLRNLFEYAKAQGDQKIQDLIFEVRFGAELGNEWGKNDDPDDIDTIWQLLRDLPSTNVEGNTSLNKIKEGSGGGGFYTRDGTIEIGEGNRGDDVRFADVLRHEVGHAVHAQRKELVNAWLLQRFGWHYWENDEDGVRAWVDAMGGMAHLSKRKQSEVVKILLQAAGEGSTWQPGELAPIADKHPWRAPDFGPRLAFEQSGAYWYRNHACWHRANGLAFCINFWYQRFMVVKAETLDQFVANMPSNYAAMSHMEFFAELYALYYGPASEARAALPQDVCDWLQSNIGAAGPAGEE
ncbi:CpXC domain-containing protein [Massilia sp. W12]|uniref:CpXC domain-containing protein n=1 Tax=Massilia sp. W12 TaxID=3126507 RepID=UPI0030D020BD